MTEDAPSPPLPIQVAARLAGRPGRVLLHSGRDDDGCGRYSFAAADPVQTIEARGQQVVVRDASGAVISDERRDPFTALQQLVDAADTGQANGPTPIALGYLGYDLGRVVEKLPTRACSDTSAPDLWFGIYDRVWRYDRITGQHEWIGRSAPEPARSPPELPELRLGPLCADQSRAAYDRAFEQVQHYIQAGDVYQVNLARRLRARILVDGDALGLYQRLHAASPCAYGAVIEAPSVRVVSGSPELFLRRAPYDSRLETRPIKGTRRRTGDARHDGVQAAELAVDEKELAEHLMIVDLERNDLGRVAQIGSVRVEEFGRVIELPTLFHMISTVACDLRPQVGIADILRATFPGGSITGAPKVRAMEIIEELEPSRRGIYTGAFGYLGAGGSLELAIAIRVASLSDGALHLHVGGGVVSDSTSGREYVETEEKAAAWRAALSAPDQP